MQSNSSAGMDRAALPGIRVLDLADNAVAYGGRLLADLGAEVIRIEPPHANGMSENAAARCAQSLTHAFWNANKKSITLDLVSPDGARLFGDLAAKSDVVIETFAPGTLSSWGSATRR